MSINRHLSDLAKSIDSASPGDFLGIHDSGGGNFHHVINGVFDVVNNGASAYTFTGSGFSSGSDNPTLYLYRGQKYRFNIAATGHPFEIRLSNGGSAYNTGVVNNAAADGAIIFAPDMSAPNSLVYQCTVHSGMVGDIVILDNTSFLDSAETINLIDSAYISNRFPTGGSSTIIAPIAFARVATTSNGSDKGISWSNWNAGTGEMDFTFSTAQPDTDYIVVTDAETFDDYYVGISSKTVNGFTASFYDGSGVRSPSSASPFAIIVYGSTPTQRIAGYVGNFLDSANTISLIDSAYVQARQTTVGSGGGGLDSAAVTSLVDSAYVSARSSGGGGGGAGLSSFNIVSQHITSSQVVESDQNAFSVGPTIVDSSVTLTIKSGARYVVI